MPALVWVHGGGYVIGTAAQDDDLCRRYVRHLGIAVASVDYRLAPEAEAPVAAWHAAVVPPIKSRSRYECAVPLRTKSAILLA